MVLAAPTAAFKLSRIVQNPEGGRVAVDVRKFVCPHIANYEGQESRGADLAGMGYKHNAMAVADAEAST